MPRVSIEYMNARRESARARTGAARPLVNPADLRSRDKGKDSLDLAADYVWTVMADLRAFLRESDNRLAALRLSPDLANEEPIPF